MIRSNVFNLAALLGMAAVVVRRIGFRRRVVVLAAAGAVLSSVSVGSRSRGRYLLELIRPVP